MIFDWLLALIYPCKCVFCGSVLKSGDICSDCLRDLPYTKTGSVEQKLPFIEKCVSPLYYKDNVRRSVLRFKFSSCSAYAGRYGAMMADCAQKNLDCGMLDVISWVPLSRKRLRTRGYDQAGLLAHEISRRTGIPCVPLLKKVRNTAAQSSLKDPAARRANIAGAYALAGGNDIEKKRILLCDDVVTTGSTLSEAARILRKAGAKSVWAVTLARHED